MKSSKIINDISKEIKSTILYLQAHPDNEIDSECRDRLNGLVKINSQLKGIEIYFNVLEKTNKNYEKAIYKHLNTRG